MIQSRAIRLSFVVLLCTLLAGCVYNRLVESRTISPQTEGCTAERYRPAIDNLRDIPTRIWPEGVSRLYPEGMQGYYRPLAAEILALPPISQGRCEIEFAFALYLDGPWSVRVTITEDQSGVCIRHRSFDTKEGQGPQLCVDR